MATGYSSFVFVRAASKTSELVIKGASALRVLAKSYLLATASFLSSALTGGPEFTKGVGEGAGQWGLDAIKSGINQQVLTYNLATKPFETISQIQESLSSEISSLLSEGGKIMDGDFSSITTGLDNFAKKSVREHGNFAGKVGMEAAVTGLTAGGGAAANAGGKVSRVGSGAASRVYEVGSYNTLRGVEAGLDAHHVGQRALMKKFVAGYNPNTAPSILVPKRGHTVGSSVLSRGKSTFSNARQVLARDIFELRRVYRNVPNSSLKKLIQMNKKMYPRAFKK